MNKMVDQSLKSFNTFGIDANCKVLYKVDSIASLKGILAESLPPYFILGGGSNLLISKDQDVTFLKNEILGKEIIYEDDDTVQVKVGGGENWHEFVLWAITHDFGGIENLSLIPGTVGASPIQNIGAYGVELEQVFVGLEAMNLEDQKLVTFNKSECSFGYRDSVFKNKLKGRYFITHVTFELTKKNHHINISYAPLAAMLNTNATIKEVSDEVIAIRKSKLPDPSEIGNSGSFFKNPIIPKNQYFNIQERISNIPSYPVDEQHVKIPAGWLIDQAGWKGKRKGDAGVYEKQALVLVNHGNASGPEIWALAQEIIADVKAKFGIVLSPEVNII